ncbi:uncharacterized protein LOC120341356 [Styela clava]
MSFNKAVQDNRDKEISLSQKELLLMRLSNHIEQAQVDSPAFMLSSLAQKGSEELVAEFFGDQPFMDSSSLENFMQSQLYVCTFWGLHDIAKILLDNKADPNFKNAKTLWTPLHAAAFQDHGRVVMLLLEYGANPMSEDYKGRTPADFASASDKIWSHFDIMNISRTSKQDLIKKNILRGNQDTLPENSVSSNKHEIEKTTSTGIKLADYSSPSNHSAEQRTVNYVTPLPISSQRSRSVRTNASTPDNSIYENSLFDSTTLPLSRPESQINDIFGSGSSTTRSSVMTSSNTSRRSSRTNNSSANMSSILTWD